VNRRLAAAAAAAAAEGQCHCGLSKPHSFGTWNWTFLSRLSRTRRVDKVGLQILALPSGLVPSAHDAAVTYQRNWDKHRKLPMIMFVIIGGNRPIMVDTGTPDADFVREYFGYTFERPDSEDPLLQLNEAGVDPADVRDVIFTHLHWDHCSNVELFPNARFTVQDDELRYAVSPIPLHRRAYQHLPRTAPPWLPVLDRLNPVSGAVEIAPGVSTVPLPGHTPGSQGILVDTDKGKYLIAGDCLDSYDNWYWNGEDGVPHVPSWSFTDVIQFDESFRRIESLGCEPIPSHDERVLATRVFG
jgi:N-acyl homoserine lactone hydrolase